MPNGVIKIMVLIISKLTRMDKWGGSHTEITNLTKGLPEQYKRDKTGKKIIQKAIEELIKNEFLIVKKSTGEIHVSLNPKKKEEMYNFMTRNLMPP